MSLLIVANVFLTSPVVALLPIIYKMFLLRQELKNLAYGKAHSTAEPFSS